MSTELEVLAPASVPATQTPIHVLATPWRDPHTVSPRELAGHIERLEKACLENPQSADLRTCLGMAHAMNYDVYRSMDALEIAVKLDETHFFAQMKYAELFYRIRALPRALDETTKALNLAGNAWELAIARKQLQEVRRLTREGTQKPEWSKPLPGPFLTLLAMTGALCLVMAVWK